MASKCCLFYSLFLVQLLVLNLTESLASHHVRNHRVLFLTDLAFHSYSNVDAKCSHALCIMLVFRTSICCDMQSMARAEFVQRIVNV